MPRNRYLDRRSRSDYARGRGRDRAMDSELRERYDAKREEIARHRDYMRRKQMSMQPYRSMLRDSTEFEYQSAFEIPGEDYARRGSNQYEMKYDRDFARGIGSSNSNRRDYEPYGESYYYPPLAPQDYASGRRYRDRDYYDYNYDYDYARGRDRRDYAEDEKEWHKDLEKFTEKLKRKDRFHVKKEDIIASAKQMGVKFDEFSEEEFYAVYLMMVSDYKAVANDFRSYVNMAKEWLMDDDIEVSPSEKLCIYYYEIVKGEGMDD